MLLVVSNDEDVADLSIIPWDKLKGVMIVNCVKREGKVHSHYELKQRLREKCKEHFIPLSVRFCVPHFEATPPRELLIGNGLIESSEVMLYGDLIGLSNADEGLHQGHH